MRFNSQKHASSSWSGEVKRMYGCVHDALPTLTYLLALSASITFTFTVPITLSKAEKGEVDYHSEIIPAIADIY